jgi:hypothetical protein
MKKALAPVQSFKAMQLFLGKYIHDTSGGSIALLLEGMQFVSDNETANPILWQDWQDIVGNRFLSSTDAFKAMKTFLGNYFKADSLQVQNLFNDIAVVIDKKAGWEKIIHTWQQNVEYVLK